MEPAANRFNTGCAELLTSERPAGRDILSHMRKTLIAIAALAGCYAVAGAQDDSAEYQTWMKSLQPQLRAIRMATDNAAAKDDAEKLADTFDKLSAFWKARSADDAVKLSETARDAAKAIASGSGDKAANLQAIQGTCTTCHSAHRDGTAPNFKIK